MARIYISSTYSDLKACRQRVYDALSTMDHHVVAMEHYVADDNRPRAKCLLDVARCDIYVGLFAWRYGFIPEENNPAQRSITELEFRHARECGIPTLIFILNENASWPKPFISRDEELRRIESLRAELAKLTTVSFFSDCENLAALVNAAVSNKVNQLKEEKDKHAGTWLEKHLDHTESEFVSHMRGMDRLSADQASARYVQLLVEKESTPDQERAPARPLSEYALEGGTKLAVLGDGGTGKTTSLLRLAFDAARKAKLDPTAPIPIYAKLNFFDSKETGFDKLIEIIAASTGLHRDQVLSLWKDDARPILFLMDGFNEVGSDFQSSCALALEALIQRPQHIFVITSRPTSQAHALVERCKIEELKFVQLNDDQLEDFLTRHGAAHLYQQMESELKDLVRNPFLLWGLAQSCVGLAKSELPSNKGQLYRNLIDKYLFETHEAQKQPSPTEYNYERVKKPVLAAIALRMVQEGVTRKVQDIELLREVHKHLTGIRTAYGGLIDLKELMPDPQSAKGILDETVLNGVLRSVGNTLEFMHQSVQDYFAAVGMLDWKADEILKLAPRASFRRRDERSDGFDAIIMLAGLKKDTRELLKTLIGHNPLLAAHCFAAASTAPRTILDELLGQLRTMLSRPNPEQRELACACLGAARIQSEEFQRELINLALFDKAYVVRAASKKSLAQTKSNFALSYLLNLVLSVADDDQTLGNAQDLLFDIDATAAIRALFDEWRKAEPNDERRRRAEILLTHRWYKVTVSDQLALIRIDAIRRGDMETSESAREALNQLDVWQQMYQKFGSFPDPSSFPRPSELMKRLEENKRLKNTVPSMSLAELIENLNQRMFIAAEVATELSKRGEKECLEPLIEALYQQVTSKNIVVIAQSLESVDRARATQLLRKDLQSSDFATQTRAAVALGLMGDFEPITLVHQALRVEIPAFRGAAAGVLGTCGNDEAISELVDAAKSEPKDTVLHQILFALSSAKSTSASEALLNLLLRWQSVISAVRRRSRRGGDIRGQLIRAVVEVAGANQVIDWLQEAARDPDSSVRANAINALGDFEDTSIDIQSSLREALEDPEGTVRAAAFREVAKATNTTKDLASLFEEGLKDDDADVRIAVLEELADRRLEGAEGILIESALADSASSVRHVAAVKLRSFQQSAVERLSQLLPRENIDRRLAAVKTLGILGNSRSYRGIRPEALDEKEKDKILAVLAMTLSDRNERVRLEVVKAMQSISDSESELSVIPTLVEIAWHSESVAARQEAAGILEYMDGGKDALFKPIWDHPNSRSEYERLIKLIGENEPFLPNNGYLYAQRASFHLELQNFDKAYDDYQHALRFGFDGAWLRTGYTQVCANLGRHEEALKAAQKRVEYELGDANAHGDLGWYAYKAGDYEKSIEESRLALGLDPSLAIVAFNLGLSYLATRQLEEAEAAYDQALKICNNMSTEDAKATIRAALKDIDEFLAENPELAPSVNELKSRLSFE